MKRNVLFTVALFATLTASAQNIAAVSPSNVTTMYQTLDKAITDAEDGSIIYLPGGGFQIKDETKITKSLTIMGVSHRADADNADGATVIAGNLNFEKGSSGSSVTGVFISGNINVGTDVDSVNNLTIRYCNVNSIQVRHSQSSGMAVNQCYLRNGSNFGYCNVQLENNIVHSVGHITGGIIDHNIIAYSTTGYNVGATGRYGQYYQSFALGGVHNSRITNNILLDCGDCHNGDNCIISNNSRGTVSWGEESVVMEEGKTWDDVFGANKGISVNSKYHLTSSWGKKAGSDGTDIGIYGGSGFKDDKSLAPIPRIVSKKVDEHTDGSGNLHIEITVKAD